MKRRAFLQSSTALTAAALASAADTTTPTQVRRMRVALVPGSIGVTAASQRELIGLARRHGFEAVEPRATELAAAGPGEIAAIRSGLADAKLVWAATSLSVDFRKDDATFRSGLAELPRLAAGLRRAGADRIGTWIPPSHDTLTYRPNLVLHASRLREVAVILGDHGIRLGLEYVGTQLNLVAKRYPFVHTMAEARDLIAEIGRPNVGLVLDTWHWWTAGDTVEEIRALQASDIVSVDLNDAPRDIPKPQQKDGERELPLATGVIDTRAFMRALQATGFDGPVRCEPFNKPLNALDNDPACAAVSKAMHAAMALIG
ncbi:MAG: sugar phosphate isomerase/epimerase [Opitutaceae bacterium]|jgi:sugar phosphate isomerase/epimerase|nr:sugar phosphate isomerase/epimerase [Opitutaceae bacterium]